MKISRRLIALMVGLILCACSLSPPADPPADGVISTTAAEASTSTPLAISTPTEILTSTTYADLTGDLYPNLPVHESGSIRSVNLHFTTYTRVDSQELAAFYRQGFTRAGWKLVGSKVQPLGQRDLDLFFETDAESEKGRIRTARFVISDTVPGLHTVQVRIGDFQAFDPDLPIHAGSTLVHYGGELDYTTRASPEEVIAFYKSHNVGLGWEFEGRYDALAANQGSRGYLLFSKNGDQIQITIEAEDSDSESNPVDVAIRIVHGNERNSPFTSDDFAEAIGFIVPIEETIQVLSPSGQVSYRSKASSDEIFIFYRNAVRDAGWIFSEEGSYFETIPSNGETDLTLRFGRNGDRQLVSLRAGGELPPETLLVRVRTELHADTFRIEEIAKLTGLVFPDDAQMKGFWQFTTASDLGHLSRLYQDAFSEEEGWLAYRYEPLLDDNQSLYLRQLYFQRDDQEISVRFEPLPEGEDMLVSASKSYKVQFASGAVDFPPEIEPFIPVDDPKAVEADENQMVYRTRLPFHESLSVYRDWLELKGWELRKAEIFLNPDKRTDPVARSLQERVNQLNAGDGAMGWNLLDDLAEQGDPEEPPGLVLLWVTLTLEKEGQPFDLVLFLNLDDIRGGTTVSVRRVFR